MHLVLLFFGFSCVLNTRLCFFAYPEHVLTIFCSPSSDGDSKTMSSAYTAIPTNFPFIQQPSLFRRSSLMRSSMYTQNSMADNTAPCFTPFRIEKALDSVPFHFSLAVWFAYMYKSSRKNIGETCRSINFLKSKLCLTQSKAFFMSMKQEKISLPFLVK